MRVLVLSLAMLCVTAAPGSAHFLFVRILPQAEAGRAAEVFFSDKPDEGDDTFIDKIAHTKLWSQREPGTFEPLTVVKRPDRLRAVLPGQQTLGVVGECQYGVIAREGKPSFLLRHFPKAVTGDPKMVSALKLKAEIPFEIGAQFDEGTITFTAYRHGKPIPKAEFTIIGTSPRSTTLTAGEDGKATWKATLGSFGAYTYQKLNEAGTVDGKKYDEIREFTLLAFRYPLVRTEGDPEAYKHFQEAISQRAAWEKFPGFSADLEASVDGKTSKGRVHVDRKGDVKIEGVDDGWVKDRLDSLVMHRMAQPRSEPAKLPVVYYGDNDVSHPLGRLVVFEGGKFASSYRVKDKQLMTVNRHTSKSNMTITILENDTNAEGKVLPRSYTVQYWDAVTGQVRRTEAVHERWTRVSGLDVPTFHQSIDSSAQGLSIHALRLTNHRVGE